VFKPTVEGTRIIEVVGVLEPIPAAITVPASLVAGVLPAVITPVVAFAVPVIRVGFSGLVVTID
jgi:hypothetical protein